MAHYCAALIGLINYRAVQWGEVFINIGGLTVLDVRARAKGFEFRQRYVTGTTLGAGGLTVLGGGERLTTRIGQLSS